MKYIVYYIFRKIGSKDLGVTPKEVRVQKCDLKGGLCGFHIETEILSSKFLKTL